MNPQVEIFVPTFNSASTLGVTLDSLLSQTYDNYKITVIDNQSTDQTLVALDPYLKKKSVRLIVNEKNLGGEGSFNRCIEEASQDYFCICHSDDIYLPKFIENQVAALQNNPSASVSFCHAERVDFSGEVLGERFLPAELKAKGLSRLKYLDLLQLSLKYGNVITCPSAFFRTATMKKKSLRFEAKLYKSSSDLGLWLKLAAQGGVIFLGKSLLKYRESEASFSFELKKVRLHRHDLFLVLDEAILKEKDQLDLEFPGWNGYFEFLEFKDQMLRTFNVIKSRKWNRWPDERFRLVKVLSLAFASAWHMKFAIKAMGIYILSRPYKWVRMQNAE